MAHVKVKLLRPLNGEEIGSEKTYDKADADRLAASGAVKILGAAKASDGEDADPRETKMDAEPANKATSTTKRKGK